ncbi:MAG: allophanate hydrolase, partial [Akkermansiaceae bacterium]
MESCQAGDFSSDAMQEFYRSDFTVTPDSDRMGMRLEGNAAVPGPKGIVSEGIALGAIQVPADGHPIVLLNDRQTLGGYPKLGVIARVDLPRLCQARPGTRIRFSPVSIELARQEWQDFCGYFGL